MNQYLCIIAGQRAGTTALQSALGSTGKFFNFKEVFHTNPRPLEGSFLDFCQRRDLRVADMTTEVQARQLGLDYLAHLRTLAGSQIPLLDIKHNSWQVMKPFWSYVHQPPFFMNLLLDQGAHFLFVRRRDLVGQVVSEQIARSVNKWHGLEDQDVSQPIHVEPGLVASQARLILQSEAFLLGCLAGSGRFIAIDYEDLYPEGAVNPRLLKALQKTFGIDLPTVLEPSIKKNAPDKQRVVDNYQEVTEAVNAILQRFPRPAIPKRITQ